jgi:hypothetical protein
VQIGAVRRPDRGDRVLVLYVPDVVREFHGSSPSFRG